MRGLRLPDDVAKRDKRHPFSVEQLHAIFNAPLYRDCLDGERGYAKPGSERPRNARFWVPLIALYSGMRLNEICQLDTADIREIDGTRCFVVSDASVIGSDDKSLKTGASERIVPIHRTLMDYGLLAFVEDQRKAKQAKLFHDIDPGPRGKRAVAFSKWFTQFSRACGAYQPRTSFHSFRHNFVHAIPPSKQVVAHLRELQQFSGPEGYVFPAFHTSRRPMSENTMDQAFRRMGYTSAEVTAHGLRTTGSTLLNEKWKMASRCYRALAHGDRAHPIHRLAWLSKFGSGSIPEGTFV